MTEVGHDLKFRYYTELPETPEFQYWQQNHIFFDSLLFEIQVFLQNRFFI